MAKEKGTNVDAEVRLELAEFKTEIHTTIIDSISNGFKEVEKHLSQLFNKDIDNIKETQKRYAQHHSEHFQNDKNRISDINKVKESIEPKINSMVNDKFKMLETKINSVSDNQIKCQASEKTKDKIEDKADRKKEISIGMVGMLCTASSLIVGVIVYLVK